MAKPKTPAPGKPTADDFKALAHALGETEWDLMVVCDGSGHLAADPCGFYAASCHRWGGEGFLVAEHYGGTNGGTNNYAEIEPFLVALWQFEAGPAKVFPGPHRVVCVSDSEVTVRGATRDPRTGEPVYRREANRPLWAGYEAYEASPRYRFRWRHVGRNSNPINARADHVAGLVRKAFQGIQI